MNTEPLTDEDVETALGALHGWVRENGTLLLQYEADDFPAAIHLVNVVAMLAEQARHHPDIDIRWRRLTFRLTTHSAGSRITGLDIEMAAQINTAIARQPPAR